MRVEMARTHTPRFWAAVHVYSAIEEILEAIKSEEVSVGIGYLGKGQGSVLACWEGGCEHC